jgi:hypothetical protein
MRVLFSESDARRIAKVVKRSERTPIITPSDTRHSVYSPGAVRQTLRGKLQAQLNKDGSAAMKVWYFDGTNETESSETIIVFDWFLKSGQNIASGKKVVAQFDPISARYYVTSAECS